MPTDYTFMKTGLVGTCEPSPQFMNQVVALVYTMMRFAARSAATYTLHAARRVVTTQDVLMALQYEGKRFMTRPDLEVAVSAYTNAELQELQDAGNVRIESGNDEVPFSPGRCACCMCTSINETAASWDPWIPGDDIDCLIKQAVDRTLTQTADSV